MKVLDPKRIEVAKNRETISTFSNWKSLAVIGGVIAAALSYFKLEKGNSFKNKKIKNPSSKNFISPRTKANAKANAIEQGVVPAKDLLNEENPSLYLIT